MDIYQILTFIFSAIIVFLIILVAALNKTSRSRFKTVEDRINVLTVSLRDIKNKEKNSLKLIDIVIDKIPYGIILLDPQLKILKLNENAASMFYLDKDKVTGLKTIFLFNNKNLEDLIADTSSENLPKRKEIIFYGEEDKKFEVESVPVNFHNCSLLIILKNITQETEFSRLRSQFVANVSHEMRTPLTSIKGYLETITENALEDKAVLKRYLAKTLTEVERLYELIEDLLNLSSIEHRRNVLIGQKHNIIPVINDCISSLDFLAEKNNINITFNHSHDIIEMITDEELFRQLVRNMIENSIFHGGRDIELKINVKKNDSNIVLIFNDNGAGIEKKDIPYIFQRFYRGKNNYALGKTSSGLGLSIVKHITELHRGSIEIRSIPGKETIFKFIFPM
jgi:two-component system, OmpR family, phosphate regulon sensor histidine kinase PhoR